MKRVSYKVAKAIAIPYLKSIISPEIGEEDTRYGKVNVFECLQEYSIPERYMRGNGKETWGWSDYCFECIKPFPTYIEVWLWLWREKGFRFELSHPEYKGEYDFDKLYCNVTSGRGVTDDYSDPEEAIIAAIEHLVDNDLIK